MLLFNDGELKICGYGLHFINSESNYKNIQTINYSSPLYRKKQCCDEQINYEACYLDDFYSLGLSFFNAIY